jgi:hypothetical protein
MENIWTQETGNNRRWRKLHSSLNVIRKIKSRMRWEGMSHVSHKWEVLEA